MKKWLHSYHPRAALTIVLWSLAYVFTRLALRHFTALSLGFLRYFVASLALVVMAFARKMRWPKWSDMPWFLLSGAVGFFLYMIAYNQGQAQVTAATASFIIATVPALTALLARFVYRERLRFLQWVSIGVQLCGVAVLTMTGGAFSLNAGLGWLLLAALALSAYNLIQRNLTRTYTPFQSSAVSIFCGTALLSVFSPAAFSEAARAPAIQFVYLAVMGVGSGALAYAAWASAFARAEKTSQVSNYMFLTPLLTSLLGFLIAGERPGASTLIGGAMILLGALLFHARGRNARRP